MKAIILPQNPAVIAAWSASLWDAADKLIPTDSARLLIAITGGMEVDGHSAFEIDRRHLVTLPFKRWSEVS